MLRTRQFGCYQIIRKIARGMTDVYLAYDTAQNRQAVLKIVEESPDPLTQLILEAERRGAELQRQLHAADARVIEIYEYGEQDGYFFISMQFIEGRTVAEILKEEQRLEPERAARFAIEILSQLGQLHSFTATIDGQPRSIVHGDIKPSNVQIGSNDEVRLLDFGIAKALTFTHSRTHLNLGSPSYCSPERLSRGQVDRHADLWAVGVTLYEMVAGTPPYQAQDTRKLEALIQSRRPPRALPESCPPPLRAILTKALAGDLHQRYVSAQAFETDLRQFLQNRPTAAETERRTSWASNPTVEKPRLEAFQERVSGMAQTVRSSVLRLKPSRAGQVASLLSILVALCWGLLAGLVVFVPAGYYYRFLRESRAIRGTLDFTQASVADINANWSLWQRVERQNAFLGGLSPARPLAPNVRSAMLQAGDEVMEHYRNSSDPQIRDFDWAKAAACFEHARALDGRDRAVEGKLAVANGYVDLLAGHAQAAQADFKRAVPLLPQSPDPHLGLARVYIYSVKNVGKAIAELHEAERVGFELGPREAEEQGDGYRMRGAAELNEAQREAGKNRVIESRFLRLARRDFERARELYEPIQGFSNVSAALGEVDEHDHARQQMEDALAVKLARRQRRTAHRSSRWP